MWRLPNSVTSVVQYVGIPTVQYVASRTRSVVVRYLLNLATSTKFSRYQYYRYRTVKLYAVGCTGTVVFGDFFKILVGSYQYRSRHAYSCTLVPVASRILLVLPSW